MYIEGTDINCEGYHGTGYSGSVLYENEDLAVGLGRTGDGRPVAFVTLKEFRIEVIGCDLFFRNIQGFVECLDGFFTDSCKEYVLRVALENLTGTLLQEILTKAYNGSYQQGAEDLRKQFRGLLGI